MIFFFCCWEIFGFLMDKTPISRSSFQNRCFKSCKHQPEKTVVMFKCLVDEKFGRYLWCLDQIPFAYEFKISSSDSASRESDLWWLAPAEGLWEVDSKGFWSWIIVLSRWLAMIPITSDRWGTLVCSHRAIVKLFTCELGWEIGGRRCTSSYIYPSQDEWLF